MGAPRSLLEQVAVFASASAAVPFIAGAQFLSSIFVVCDFALRCICVASNVQVSRAFKNRAHHQLDWRTVQYMCVVNVNSLVHINSCDTCTYPFLDNRSADANSNVALLNTHTFINML